jgi:hypothetical protein
MPETAESPEIARALRRPRSSRFRHGKQTRRIPHGDRFDLRLGKSSPAHKRKYVGKNVLIPVATEMTQAGLGADIVANQYALDVAMVDKRTDKFQASSTLLLKHSRLVD